MGSKMLRLVVNSIISLPAKFSIVLLRFWHLISRPLLGEQCRFYPSCSVYTREAIEEIGFLRGWIRGLARVAKCHPFNEGGFDPFVEEKQEPKRRESLDKV